MGAIGCLAAAAALLEAGDVRDDAEGEEEEAAAADDDDEEEAEMLRPAGLDLATSKSPLLEEDDPRRHDDELE